ncbi:MAG: CPBP family intramembrane metalloprotease [Firmicutes bacterium]|nr:CPBP family intramembrane metalloprotease [Bacillota bacterium]
MKENNKKTLTGIGVFLLYFFVSQFQGLPFWILNIDTAAIPEVLKAIYVCAVQILLVISIIYIYRQDIKNNLEDLKKNHQTYFKKYLKYWFLALGLMMVANSIILISEPNSIAGNEEAVREMFNSMPIYTFISAVIIAPFLEELVFRKSFRDMFSNNLLFIILSGLTFGAFHVIGSFETLFDLIYIIPYSIPGFVFAYTLSKSKNIFVPIGLHFLHNGILMALQTFLMLFS